MEYIAFAKGALQLAWVLSLAIGGLVLFTYLGGEGIFPRGLSLGDSLLLIYAASMFGFIMLVGISFGAAFSYWLLFLIVEVMERIQKNKSDGMTIHPAIKGWGFVVTSLFMFLLFALGFYYSSLSGSPENFSVFAYFFAVGISLLFFWGVRRKGEGGAVKNKLSIFFLIIIMLILSLKPALSNLTMTAIGLRSSSGELVALNFEDKEKVIAVAALHGLKVSFCGIANTGLYGTLNLLVIWHRVGETSYVRVRGHRLVIPLGRAVETYPSGRASLKCS